MQLQDRVWQEAELTQTYLNGVRGAIPLANEQIDVMLRLIRAARRDEVTAVLDLGCGDGILGQFVLDEYPKAQGVFVDFSPPMLQAAEKRLADYNRVSLVEVDYGEKGWENRLRALADWGLEIGNQGLLANLFDVIVSGFSIHHQPNGRKQELYQEIYRLLKPGGIFVNVEHVASHSYWGERQHDAYFVDSLVHYHQQQGAGKTRQQVMNDYYHRDDKMANILTPVETQCAWLRASGFQHVDCYLKIFELAVFGGIKED